MKNFFIILAGCSFVFALGFSKGNATNLDEVICNAMKGMQAQEEKKIPYNIDSYELTGINVDCKKKALITEKKHIEFLLSDKAQEHIVNNTYEYPLSANVAPSDLIAQFGTGFKEDQTSVADYGKFNPEAVKLMDRVGWQ